MEISGGLRGNVSRVFREEFCMEFRGEFNR